MSERLFETGTKPETRRERGPSGPARSAESGQA